MAYVIRPRIRRVAPVLCLALAGLVLLTGRAGAETWTIKAGEVKVTCPLTVGGSFDAKTRAVSGTYDPAGGATAGASQFMVDLKTLETGIALRDSHLRGTYLEVDRSPDHARAVLSGLRLNGIDATAPSGKGTFTATLRLHGVERQVTGQAEVRRAGATAKVRATFPVSIAEFDIATPRYLGVGVKDEVSVQITFDSTSGGA